MGHAVGVYHDGPKLAEDSSHLALARTDAPGDAHDDWPRACATLAGGVRLLPRFGRGHASRWEVVEGVTDSMRRTAHTAHRRSSNYCSTRQVSCQYGPPSA